MLGWPSNEVGGRLVVMVGRQAALAVEVAFFLFFLGLLVGS